MEEFQENIKQWVAVDTQLKSLNETVRELRLQRAHLGDDIFIHVDTHNLSDAIVSISDGNTTKVNFVKNKEIINAGKCEFLPR